MTVSVAIRSIGMKAGSIEITVSSPVGMIGPIEPDTVGAMVSIGIVATGSSVYSSTAEASISGRIARLIASRAAVEALAVLA